MVDENSVRAGDPAAAPLAAADVDILVKRLDACITVIEGVCAGPRGERAVLENQLRVRETRINERERAHRQRWLTAGAGALGAVMATLLIVAVAWGGKSYTWPDVALLCLGVLSIAAVVWAVRGRARNDD